MSGGAVPADDLPGNLVPDEDLPDAKTSAKRESPGKVVADTGKGVFAAIAGGPVDLATLVMRPFGYNTPSEQVVGSSDYLSKKLGASANLGGSAYKLGGVVTDAASKVLPPEGAAAAGFIANVGAQAIPMFLGGKVGEATAPLFDGTARGLMRSALKPTLKAVQRGEADKAVNTMLREGYNVSRGSLEKMANRVDDLNSGVAASIANSNATINPAVAAQPVRDTLAKFGKQVDSQADIDAITGVVSRFLANHPGQIPVQVAQELKQGTYRVLSGKYGELGSASTEAQKAIARGLKDEIAKAVPNVHNLNKLESELLNAMKLTSRRLATAENANPLGITHLSPSWKQLAAGLLDRSSWGKSTLANGLYSGSIQGNVGRVGGGILGLYAGRPPEDEQGILDRRTAWVGQEGK